MAEIDILSALYQPLPIYCFPDRRCYPHSRELTYPDRLKRKEQKTTNQLEIETEYSHNVEIQPEDIKDDARQLKEFALIRQVAQQLLRKKIVNESPVSVSLVPQFQKNINYLNQIKTWVYNDPNETQTHDSMFDILVECYIRRGKDYQVRFVEYLTNFYLPKGAFICLAEFYAIGQDATDPNTKPKEILLSIQWIEAHKSLEHYYLKSYNRKVPELDFKDSIYAQKFGNAHIYRDIIWHSDNNVVINNIDKLEIDEYSWIYSMNDQPLVQVNFSNDISNTGQIGTMTILNADKLEDYLVWSNHLRKDNQMPENVLAESDWTNYPRWRFQFKSLAGHNVLHEYYYVQNGLIWDYSLNVEEVITMNHHYQDDQGQQLIYRMTRMRMLEGGMIYRVNIYPDGGVSYKLETRGWPDRPVLYGYKLAEHPITREKCMIKLDLSNAMIAMQHGINKARCNRCVPIAIYRLIETTPRTYKYDTSQMEPMAVSTIMKNGYQYRLCQESFVPEFVERMNKVCNHGIHFCFTQEEVMDYFQDHRQIEASSLELMNNILAENDLPPEKEM